MSESKNLGKNLRVDPANDINYPPRPDGRGWARASYKAKHYYLGRFGTADSYVTFGALKHFVDESNGEGELPEIKILRDHARKFLTELKDEKPQPLYTTRWFAGALVTSVLAICVAVVLSVQIYSSGITPKVDGIPLTEQEFDFVRGSRDQKLDFENQVRVSERSRSDILKQMMEKGPLHEDFRRKNVRLPTERPSD